MLIRCMTLKAAFEVLLILLSAGLRPGGAVHLTGPCPPDTPVHFTFTHAPPTHILEQLHAISDTIVEQKAT
jgi:hypothetical protein